MTDEQRIAELEARVAELEALLRDMLTPSVWVKEVEDGVMECVFCGEQDWAHFVIKHAPTCTLVRLEELGITK